MNSVRRVALVIAANLVLFELLSAGAIFALGRVRRDLRIDLYIQDHFDGVTESYHQAYIEKGYDRLLGLDNRPGTSRTLTATDGRRWTATYGADGARDDPHQWESVGVATYGDSFTHCDEVANDETWQFYLEELIGAEVKNYGVGSYGVDQGVMKAIRHLEQGRVAPMTLLLIDEIQLNRAITNFRPFYNRRSTFRLTFKPAHVVRNGEVVYSPNPWADPTWPLSRLQDVATELAETDYWVDNDIHLRQRFPHCTQLVGSIPNLLRNARCRARGGDCPADLWLRPEGEMILLHLLDELSAATAAADSRLVVVFIPPVNKWRHGRLSPLYRGFVDSVISREHPEIAVVDLDDATFDPGRFNVMPYAGHVSPYGNRVIARTLAPVVTALLVDAADQWRDRWRDGETPPAR